MPELPEVETMVRGIGPYVEGREIVTFARCRCSCKPIITTPGFRQLVSRVKGCRVLKVRRLGKRVVLDICSGDSLVIEPRMTGLMLLSDPPDRSHLRFVWRFSGQKQFNEVWFWDRRGLGTVRLYSAGELADALGPKKLGPDALEMSVEEWRRRCASTKRPIKVAMLDQRLTAGIGNLYASEILHAARIHPDERADTLKPRHIRRIRSAVQRVLSDAIRDEGSTLSDATYRTALNRHGRYQARHRVYQRDNQPCGTCGEAIVKRIVQAQRATFFCPVCQKRATDYGLQATGD